MGQQQLLLLVLGITVVGIAVVIAIQVYSNNQKKNNGDALASTSTRLAYDAQTWLQTPSVFGGATPTSGERPSDFAGLPLTIELMGYPVNGSGEYKDVNGTYTAAVTGANFIITATSVTTSGAGDNNVVCTLVTGVTEEDIQTIINPSTGSCS